ncbi:ATP-dependent RNA helicase [Striga asiatica]|uniref:ATP-dependent RNA helicase n=1 Tax=Striga asiatica TaxID=4170 RepID=A0A5A7PMC9_STRAF|nr:ATP-dependent RNA helicase [Striga asiatica]
MYSTILPLSQLANFIPIPPPIFLVPFILTIFTYPHSSLKTEKNKGFLQAPHHAISVLVSAVANLHANLHLKPHLHSISVVAHLYASSVSVSVVANRERNRVFRSVRFVGYHLHAHVARDGEWPQKTSSIQIGPLEEAETTKKSKSGGFESLGLSPDVYNGVKNGYRVANPTQHMTIPLILSGYEVISMPPHWIRQNGGVPNPHAPESRSSRITHAPGWS